MSANIPPSFPLFTPPLVGSLQSVVGSSLVNLLLDGMTVLWLGMGITGAALATTVAQWTGLLYLAKQVGLGASGGGGA